MDLHEQLLELDDGSIEIQDEFDPGSAPEEVDFQLVDSIEDDPSNVADQATYDLFRSLLKIALKASLCPLGGCHSRRHFDKLTPEHRSKLAITVASAITSLTALLTTSLASDSTDAFRSLKDPVSAAAFLAHWLLRQGERVTKAELVQAGAATTSTGKATKGTGKGKKKAIVAPDEGWDWSGLRERVLRAARALLALDLGRVFISTAERDGIVNLFTKPIYQLMEDKDAIKQLPVDTALHVLCICVAKHGHGFGAKTTIFLNLTSYDHLSELMAEFLHTLASNHGHVELADEVLRDIGQMDFNVNEGEGLSARSTVPKSFASFLIRLSTLSPRIVLRQMAMLQNLLDAESYTIRSAFIEVTGTLIEATYGDSEDRKAADTRLAQFWEVVLERTLDSNAFVRAKVMQTIQKMAGVEGEVPELKAISSERRKVPVNDEGPKNESVSNDAEEGNFEHGATVDETDEVEKDEATRNPEPAPADDEDDNPADDDVDLDLDTDVNFFADPSSLDSNDPAVDILSRKIPMLKLTLRWLNDAQRLARQLEHASSTLCVLLASKSKPEVIESMDVFVVMNHFNMDCAAEGIRRMVHLIWSKDANNEEGGKTIRDHLLDTYGELYFTSQAATEKERIENIVGNLIRLTKDATLADLTSLEHLLATIMAKGIIKLHEVVRQLWIALSRQDANQETRRGALVILSMFAKAKPEIISEQMDLLLKIGLGHYAKDDLGLAKYACIGLQQLVDDKHRAINTIFKLSEHPDKIAASIIKDLASKTFGASTKESNGVVEATNIDGTFSPSEELDLSVTKDSMAKYNDVNSCDSFDLAKVLFVAGHVAIKQIVYLESIESDLKKRKAQEPPRRKSHGAGDEIEQVVGSTDDEFTDAIALLRERELLYGESSLLAKFGPLLQHICQYNKSFDNRTLQIHATLALCKFMCVSSEFCESNLQLLFTILEKSDDPTIRGNIIIALGDMAVSFNNLIDDNINYLYNRLSDTDGAVKKNTLMVLTHLIINGMIKVKGQISEMAKCLEDSDTRIADLARLFFTELAAKDNAIYNNLPDIISNLSHPANGVDEDKFKSILKYLLEFIDKERQTENLVDKLCLRFRSAEGERQWRDISFCLSLLSFKSEKSVKKLVDHVSTYSDKLQEDTVFKHFLEIVGKAKKFQKATAKQYIEDYELKLNELREACLTNQETIQNASRVPATKTGKARVQATVIAEATEGQEAVTEIENKAVKAAKRSVKGRKKAGAKRWDEGSDDDPPKRKRTRTILGETTSPNQPDADDDEVVLVSRPTRRVR
ncbi:Condensin complex subunit [Gonapodya sp. JEL0774]|nr:Condensin complex subunit [Gonapodya sp. JEL0774]